MTKTTKPVRRVSSEYVRDRSKMRALVVTIYPGNFIGLRMLGTRREETIGLRSCYDLAVKMRVYHERAEKAKAKKAGNLT